MNDYYTPERDGVAGIEDFGAIEHGTNHARLGEVAVDGLKVIGRCTNPEAVSMFLAGAGVCPVVRFERVFDSRTPAGRVERLVGLPSSMRGPTKVAAGALAFIPGWDSSKAPRVHAEQVANDRTISGGYAGRAVTPGFAEDLAAGCFAS